MIRVNVYRTVLEAFSFAITRFETCMRVSWLPVSLILLFNFAAPFLVYSILLDRPVSVSDAPSHYVAGYIHQNFGLMFLGAPMAARITLLVLGVTFAILYASYFIDLFRLAALDEQPSTDFFSLRFGTRHAGFIVASIFGYLVVLLVAAPFIAGLAGATGFIEQRTQTESFAFFPNAQSLHYAVLDVQSIVPWYKDILLNSITIAMLLALLYFSIRLIPLPFFVAAKSSGATYGSLRAALAVSRGLGIFKLLLAYAALAVMISPIIAAMTHVVLPLITVTLGVLYGFLGVTAQLSTGGDQFPDWIRAVIMMPYLLTFLVLNVVITSFVSSVLAGFGASIYRQFDPVA